MHALIVNAHLNYPDWSEGGLNAAMADLAEIVLSGRGHSVSRTEVQAGYDPAVEVQKHVDADFVLLQTPINWFGAPWIYKRYVDEVFNSGLKSKVLLDNDGRTRSDPSRQYGTGGHMEGRRFMVSATWTAPLEAFSNPDGLLFGGHSVDDLLLNITTNYRFVCFDVLPSFGIYNLYKDESAVAAGLRGLEDHLVAHLS